MTLIYTILYKKEMHMQSNIIQILMFLLAIKELARPQHQTIMLFITN